MPQINAPTRESGKAIPPGRACWYISKGMPVVSRTVRKSPAMVPRQQPNGPPLVSPYASGGNAVSEEGGSSPCVSAVGRSSECSWLVSCSGSCESCSSENESGGVDTTLSFKFYMCAETIETEIRVSQTVGLLHHPVLARCNHNRSGFHRVQRYRCQHRDGPG